MMRSQLPVHPGLEPIHLGSSNILSREDLSRALICSTAVYMEKAIDADDFFRKAASEYPSTSFKKVLISEDKMMLVAYTEENDMFIAFRGTMEDSLEDLACNLRVDEKIQFGGAFHSGFDKRADDSMGSIHNPLSFCLSQDTKPRIIHNPLSFCLSQDTKPRIIHNPLSFCLSQDTKPRIVFCGHSLGGAVAHLALIQLLSRLGILDLEDFGSYPDSLFSIAFGAPHVCDGRAAQRINSKKHLKWRFINFVNQADPVPRLLHKIRSSLIAALRSELVNFDTTLKDVGGFLGKAVQGYAEGSVQEVLAVGIDAIRQEFGKYIAKKSKSALSTWLRDSVTSGSRSEPDFHQIGRYVFLFHEGSNEDGLWKVIQARAGNQLMGQLLSDADIELKTLEFHTIRCYMSVLTSASFLDEPVDIYCPPRDGALDLRIVTTPKPKIKFAEWRMEDSEDHTNWYIQIGGENMFFLREAAVNFNGETERNWKVIQLCENELQLFEPDRQAGTRLGTAVPVGAAMPFVKITTAFGVETCGIRQPDSVMQGSRQVTYRMFARIIQTMVLKSFPPLGLRPTNEVLQRMDRITKCLPQNLQDEHGTQQMSKKLFEITEKFRDGRDTGDSMAEINAMTMAVANYLSSTLELNYNLPSVLESLLTIISALALSLGSHRASTRARLLLRKPSVNLSQRDVLDLSIKEARAWSERGDNDSESSRASPSDGVTAVQALKSELLRRVKDANPGFKQMVTNLEVDSLKSPIFEKVTHDSRTRFLKRMKIVMDIVSLSTVMDQDYFIGILGAEDVGKSTFIKKVLELYGRENTFLPRTGSLVYTTEVKPYLLNGSKWLVDFPDINGVGLYAKLWKQFEDLPSSAVLLLDFEGALKSEQLQIYKEMKWSLQTEVTVVFNIVDRCLEDLKEWSAGDFEHLKEKHSRSFGCRKEMVCFACLEPDVDPEELEAFNARLKELGVLDFQELARKLGVTPFHTIDQTKLNQVDQLLSKLKLIRTIQDSMNELLMHVKICCTESEYLVTKSQQRSSRIQDWFCEWTANPYVETLIMDIVMVDKWDSLVILLDRFVSYMVAGEDLLSFCAKEDWKRVALSLFLPTSCESTCSKFFLVTRDLDWVANMLFNLLEAPTAQEAQPENDSMEVEIITDDLWRHSIDRERVLSKLESESSNSSSDLKIYGPLLRKRLQGDPLAEGASLVPNCFWIPGKLEYVYKFVVGAGSSKQVLICLWLGHDVAIAPYTSEYAKLDLESEAGVLARVQHPNVVNFIGCAYENIVDKKGNIVDMKGYLVTELWNKTFKN